MGLGHQTDRPDMSGLLFDVTRSGLQALVARETIAGAFETNRGLLDRLVDEGNLIYLIHNEQERGVIGPAEKVAMAGKAILRKVP